MKKLNVAVVGLGRAGSEVVRQIKAKEKESYNFPLHLITTCDERASKYLKLEGANFTDNYEEVISSSNVDVVVETVGGLSKAYDVVRSALDAGKHVVTNNRILMATHGEKLYRIAEAKAVHLKFDASILGAMPCVRTILENTPAMDITRIYGVLNSTCNYALMRMHESGITMDDAIDAAVELGYTEPNPDLDMSGQETLYKLSILRGVAFGKWTDLKKVRPRGLSSINPEDAVSPMSPSTARIPPRDNAQCKEFPTL